MTLKVQRDLGASASFGRAGCRLPHEGGAASHRVPPRIDEALSVPQIGTGVGLATTRAVTVVLQCLARAARNLAHAVAAARAGVAGVVP